MLFYNNFVLCSPVFFNLWASLSHVSKVLKLNKYFTDAIYSKYFAHTYSKLNTTHMHTQTHTHTHTHSAQQIMMIMAHLYSASNAAINDIYNYRLRRIYLKGHTHENTHCEPVWPSGKALGWYVEGPRFDTLRLSLLFKKVVVCGHCLVTLSTTSYWNIKMALIAAHLNAEVILVVTV